MGQVGWPTKMRASGLAARDQLGAEPERAAAAGRLHADDAVVVARRLAEHDRLDQLDEAGVALRAEIGFGLLGLEQDPLGRLDARRIGVLPAASR